MTSMNFFEEPLWLVMELWLRGLRDALGIDFYRSFYIQKERSVIGFRHGKMGHQDRVRLCEAIVPVLNQMEFGLERLTPSILDYPPWEIGCHFEFKVQKPEVVLNLKLADDQSLALQKFGESMAREFYRNNISACKPDPLSWYVRPHPSFSSVWVWLWPNEKFRYPNLDLYPGFVEEEIQIIMEQLHLPGFTLARLVQNQQRVEILFYYHEHGGERNVSF